MRMHPHRIIRNICALISLVMLFTGCAQRMQSIKEDGLTDDKGPAVLQSIKVSEDGYQVEIVASKPLTYTFYKTIAPLKVVVDLSQTAPGAITSPIEANVGNVKRIEVIRQAFEQTVMSRVEISLATNSGFTVKPDPDNKSKLVVTLAKAEPVLTEAKAEAKVEEKQLKVEDLNSPAPAQATTDAKQAAGIQGRGTESQPRPEESKPVAAAPPALAQGAKALTAVNVVKDGIDVVVPGGVDTFNSFKLSNPPRLILDIPGIKSSLAAKAVVVKSFGIDKARVGISPDKVRIVFDVAQKSVPPYRITMNENGVFVLLQGVSSVTPAPATAKAAKGPTAQKAPETAKEPVAQKAPEAKLRTGKNSAVEAIDFTSGEGFSRIAIKVDGECTAAKPKKTAAGWVLTISKCQLPRKLQRMLDTSAFASAVKEITPYQVRTRGGFDTKLLVKLRSDMPFDFRQEGNTIYWDIKNPATAESRLRLERLRCSSRHRFLSPGRLRLRRCSKKN